MSSGSQVELHVGDFAVVKQFYGALGFDVVWEHEAPDKAGYLVMQLHNAVLCFWPGNDSVEAHSYFKDFPQDTPRGFGVEIVLMVDDLDEFHRRALTMGAIVNELCLKPWGIRDFRIIDPFGYYLRITERYDVLDQPPYSRPSQST